MKQLPATSVDPIVVFDNLIKGKGKGRDERLACLKNRISLRYDTYSANRFSLEKMTPCEFSAEEKADLLHCYEVSTKPLDKLKARIREALSETERLKCPYCVLTAPTTWDHYLPKDNFPEFSIYPYNLIKCCGTCNEHKGTAFLDHAGQRMIAHVYFDPLTSHGRFLQTEIRYKHGIPTAVFTISKPSTMSDATFDVIQNHFTRLHLAQRYKENSPEVFSETRSIMKTHHPAFSLEQIARYLRTEAIRLKNEFSENYWKAVLMLALSNDHKFIKNCT